jgi:hypothetical protein
MHANRYNVKKGRRIGTEEQVIQEILIWEQNQKLILCPRIGVLSARKQFEYAREVNKNPESVNANDGCHLVQLTS